VNFYVGHLSSEHYLNTDFDEHVGMVIEVVDRYRYFRFQTWWNVCRSGKDATGMLITWIEVIGAWIRFPLSSLDMQLVWRNCCSMGTSSPIYLGYIVILYNYYGLGRIMGTQRIVYYMVACIPSGMGNFGVTYLRMLTLARSGYCHSTLFARWQQRCGLWLPVYC